MSIVSAAVAEAAAQLITGFDVELRAHDDDPGVNGANEAPGLDYGHITVADWSAFANDIPTLDQGGRVTASDEEVEFKDSAEDEGDIAYVTAWVEDDPSGAPGVFDVWVKTFVLTTPVPYLTGNRVYVPVGDLEIFGAGSPE